VYRERISCSAVDGTSPRSINRAQHASKAAAGFDFASKARPPHGQDDCGVRAAPLEVRDDRPVAVPGAERWLLLFT
jgi:hypothetical protein